MLLVLIAGLQYELSNFRASAISEPRNFDFNNKINFAMAPGAPSWPISIVCPTQMRVESSYLVRMTLDATGDRNELTTDGIISLRSAGFTVEPTEPVAWAAKQSLPLGRLWTVTPKSAGDQVLLFDLSKSQLHSMEIRNRMVNVFDMGAMVLGKDTNENCFVDRDSRAIGIRVRVMSLWGVSPTIVRWIQGAAAVVTFILAYPLFQEWVTSRISRAHEQNKRTIIIPGERGGG